MVKNKHIVGLTGGIASGKSEVSEIFASLGAYIIDADIISREVIAPNSEGEKELKKAFPFAYAGGYLDRKVLKEAVFSDKEKLLRLNTITHRLIFAEINKRIEKSDNEFILVVVPLMYETGFDEYLDCIINVSADLDVRIERLKKRDNIDDCLAMKIIRSQLSDEERERKADYIIRNNADLGELKRAVTEIYEKIIRET